MSRSERKTHTLKRVAKTWSSWQEITVTEAIRNSAPHMQHIQSMWANTRFEVHCFACPSAVGGFTHVVVARHGLLEPVAAPELLRIKNDLFGVEATAVEVFPAGITELSERTRHLWILPAGFSLPFGFDMPTAWG